MMKYEDGSHGEFGAIVEEKQLVIQDLTAERNRTVHRTDDEESDGDHDSGTSLDQKLLLTQNI